MQDPSTAGLREIDSTPGIIPGKTQHATKSSSNLRQQNSILPSRPRQQRAAACG